MNKIYLTLVCLCIILLLISCGGYHSNKLSSYNIRDSHSIYDNYSRYSGRIYQSPAGGYVIYDKYSQIKGRIK